MSADKPIFFYLLLNQKIDLVKMISGIVLARSRALDSFDRNASMFNPHFDQWTHAWPSLFACPVLPNVWDYCRIRDASMQDQFGVVFDRKHASSIETCDYG